MALRPAARGRRARPTCFEHLARRRRAKTSPNIRVWGSGLVRSARLHWLIATVTPAVGPTWRQPCDRPDELAPNVGRISLVVSMERPAPVRIFVDHPH
jgi:hypothetical protein